MRLSLLAALGVALLVAPADARAQAWPTKQPIKVIIPFSAGSATDIVPRTILEQVGKQIGPEALNEIMTGRVHFYFIPLPPPAA
jgi:tripartite-type tricarboxylate transporter receptor subunit TctC